MKRCTKCGIERELKEFNRKCAAKDGRRSECRICQSIDHDERKAEGKVRVYAHGGPAFKKKYGIAYTTFRDWLVREYDADKSPYWQLKQIPVKKRESYILQYKKWRTAKKAKAKRNRELRG